MAAVRVTQLRRQWVLAIVSCVEPEVKLNRAAWEGASHKHVREYQDLLAAVRAQSSLAGCELDVLRPLLLSSPAVVHLQSGHGLDDIGLAAVGAASVVGVDSARWPSRRLSAGQTNWRSAAGMWWLRCPVFRCAANAPTWCTRARAR